MSDNIVPCCTKCGAEITTGMMAAFCPYKEECELCPDDEESRAFLRAFCDGTLFETGAQHSQVGGGQGMEGGV